MPKRKIVKIVMYYDDKTKAVITIRPPMPKSDFQVIQVDNELQLRKTPQHALKDSMLELDLRA